MALDEPVNAIPAARAAESGQLSPFDFSAQLMADTGRAEQLGYSFGYSDHWLTT